MRQSKLTFRALASMVLILCALSCNKNKNDNPPDNPSPAPGSSTPTTADCSASPNSPAKVVCLSQAFLATLTTSQVPLAQLKLDQPNAIHWSGLSCGSSCRNGIGSVNMSAAQSVAARAIIAAATGTGSGEGYDAFSQILERDSNDYFIGFLGNPSLTGEWQLQFGAHNLALNISYTDGVEKGATPLFQGGEPSNADTSGKRAQAAAGIPLATLRSALIAMLASLNSQQLATAQLNTVFTDVSLGPGADGLFPTPKAGLDVSTLNSPQQDLVIAAIRASVQNADSATAANVMSSYIRGLSETYIAFSNTPYLTSIGDYVRIDGPGVWIEFVCQPGEQTYTQLRYSTIWRDHRWDYGGNFVF